MDPDEYEQYLRSLPEDVLRAMLVIGHLNPWHPGIRVAGDFNAYHVPV